MFTNTVGFDFKKKDTMMIIDVFSKYKTGLFGLTQLNISDACLEDGSMYSAVLKCKTKDERKVLNDILTLNRSGVCISDLWVI